MKLHPITWWLTFSLVAVGLIKAHNLGLALCTCVLVAIVVHRYKESGPWNKSFLFSFKVALFLISFRLFFAIFVGIPIPGHTLITLPTLPMPSWLAGLRIGGPIVYERLKVTLLDASSLAVVVLLFGAATSMTNPRRLIKSFPPIFNELGTILVIATSLTPQLVTNLDRIKKAQRMRGYSANRFLRWRQVAMPLLEDSLARSLDLAAAMDARGYGMHRTRTNYQQSRFSFKDLSVLTIGLIFLVIFR